MAISKAIVWIAIKAWNLQNSPWGLHIEWKLRFSKYGCYISSSCKFYVILGKYKNHMLRINRKLLLGQKSFKDTINHLQLFIFTTLIHCSRPPLWVGYFIHFKFICVSSIVINCYIFSSIKEKNWLINTGMCSFIWCF